MNQAHPARKFRFLFVGFMILGQATAFKNLRRAVDAMSDIEATWLPIELEPSDWLARIPFMWRSHSLRIGAAARSRVQALERSGKRFDAAFFNHILPAVLLKGFRRRVPSVDSLDVTPLDLIRHGQAYYEAPRKLGPKLLQRFKVSMTRSIYEQSAFVFPWSEFAKRSLMEDYGINSEKTIVVPPGTDLRRWVRRSRPRKRQGGLSVLFVGSEFERKGGDLLLNVAGRSEFSTWKFHLVTKSNVTAQSRNVVVHKNLTAESQELFDLYDHADVFAMPTRADFSPTNAICEAMAMGLPVISTSVCGLDEVVRDGKTGFIVPLNNADAVADRLRILSSNRTLRMKLGDNARNQAVELFDVEKSAKKMIHCMKEAVKAHNQ